MPAHDGPLRPCSSTPAGSSSCRIPIESSVPFSRAECSVRRDVLFDAHFRAAAQFGTHLDVETNWVGRVARLLAAYVEACDVPPDRREDAHRHLDSEFADAALWVDPLPGSAEGLKALAETGVRLGIVSNADWDDGPATGCSRALPSGSRTRRGDRMCRRLWERGGHEADPRIFKAAVDLLGVDADRVWFLGDMPAIDIVGARRAGSARSSWIRLSSISTPPYERVPTLAALAELVTRLSEPRTM